jgi:hypothetical protein
VELQGTTAVRQELGRALKAKQLRPTDFSLRALAESFLSREFVDNLHPKRGSWGAPGVTFQSFLEADGGAVAWHDFTNITGQIFFNYLKEAYEMEEFVFSKLVEIRQTDILDLERIPGVSPIGDEFTVIPEGGEYPNFGVTEDFIDIPYKQKRGGIVPVTKEAIFADRTGMLLERCRKLGWWLGWNREKRIIDALIDEGPGAKSATLGGHRYRWRNQDYPTFGTPPTTPWTNVVSGNGLVSWVSIQTAWLTLAQITDPFTGEPILIKPTHLIVTPDLEATAWRILNATNVQTHVGGYATSGNLQDIHAPSPVQAIFGNLQIASSRLLRVRSALATDWWLTNPKKQVAYFAAWDVTTEEAPANNADMWRRDIVFQFKASEMGAAATLEPRVACENHQ